MPKAAVKGKAKGKKGGKKVAPPPMVVQKKVRDVILYCPYGSVCQHPVLSFQSLVYF